MKRIAVILAIFAGLLIPVAAEAHVLKTDGQIGAVLHIDPNDDPIIGQPATFYFDIKDKQQKFSLDKCDCRFVVAQDGKELANQAFDQTTLPTYTFTAAGVYQVVASGQPISGSTFQQFKLAYDLRVSRSSREKTHGTVVYPIGVVAGLFVIVFLFKVFKKGSR